MRRPRWLRWLSRRWRVLVRKGDAERELDDEIRFHLEMEIREHVRSGLSEREARRRALVAFGGVERFKEEVRDVRGARWMDDLVQDLRLSLRSLVKQPVFTLAAVATLGVGIGGNVAMFAVLDASIFASMPLPDADRLVTGRSTFNDGARLGPYLSGFDFYDYRDQATTLAATGAIAPFPQRSTVQRSGEVERADVVWVTPGFFQALGVEAIAGRGFLPEEGEPGAARVAVLAHGYWTRAFGGDRSVVGRSLSLNGTAHTVVGVMPPEGRFLVDADLWVPAVRGEGMAGSRNAHNFMLVARLAPRVSVETAQAELDGISARLEEAYPDSNEGKGILLTPMRETLAEGYRSTLTLLAAAVGLLLLVACANVAGLLLARGQAREGEMAVRTVMGARRGRLVRQLLTESGVLAVVAGAVGIALAWWGQRALLAFVSLERLGRVEPGLSAASVLFALGLSLATVLLFGALPALRIARTDKSGVLRGSDKVAGSRGASRLRSGLVIAQVAVTAVLLSVAGLLGRSLQELRSADLGFDAGDLLTAELTLPSSEYGQEERIAFYEALERRLTDLPGVEDVALVSQLPVRDPGNNWAVGLPGATTSPDGETVLAHQRIAFPGYFEAMGIPLLAGRGPDAADRGGSPPALVIGESTAEYLFGTENPLGRLVEVQARGDGGPEPHRVVGVVGDVAMNRARYGTSASMYYAYHERAPGRMRLAIRHGGDATRVAPALREIVRSLDADIPLDGVESMESIVARSRSDERALALLVAIFAGVALLVASVGLYGIMAYQVARRTREIGIRMALGASLGRVSGSVVAKGLGLVLVGLVLGVPVSLLAGRLVESFLFGVGSADPVTLGAVALFLGLVSAAACYLPAHRAARVDPVEAFRAE